MVSPLRQMLSSATMAVEVKDKRQKTKKKRAKKECNRTSREWGIMCVYWRLGGDWKAISSAVSFKRTTICGLGGG